MKFINKIMSKKNLNIVIAVFFCLYIFSFITLNTPKTSFISNGILIAILGLTILRSVYFKEKKILIIIACIFPILLLFFISNAINKIFSYQFLILFSIFVSFYLLLDSVKNIYFIFLIVIIGYILGQASVLFIYFLNGNSFPSGDFYLGNIDGLAVQSADCFLFSLSYFLLTLRTKSRKIFNFVISTFGMCVSIFLIFIFKRIGPLLEIFLFSLLIVLIFLYRKKKFLIFSIIIFSVFCAILLITLIKTDIQFIQRIQLSFLQLLKPELVFEESVRARLLMVFRDLFLLGYFPFIGIGENNTQIFGSFLSHNAFGSIGLTYGSLALFIYLFTFCYLKIKTKNEKTIFDGVIFFIFFIFIFGLFYGTFLTSRLFYIWIALYVYLCKTKQNLTYFLQEKSNGAFLIYEKI